jgi:hypothetical protein
VGISLRRKPSSKHTVAVIPSDLTETERDLLSHLQNGYELETDSLGGDPLLRRRKDQEVIRPLSRHGIPSRVWKNAG